MDGRPEGQLPWHALPVDEVARALDATPTGLSSAEAAARLARFGPNRLPQPPRRSVLRIFLGQLAGPLIYLLLIAGAASLALGEFSDALFIGAVLLLNTLIGGTQEWRAEANTAALRLEIKAATRVRRDGSVRLLGSEELVPGDAVLLEGGDRVPADIRVTKAFDVRADESSLTGESFAVEKSAHRITPPDTVVGDRTAMLHAGTTLQTGRAEGIVTATGAASEIGRIAAALGQAAAPPPLVGRLDRFSRRLGLIVVGLIVVLAALQFWAGTSLRETFFVAIALAVAAIPEGLPVAVTVALSIGTRRMARRKVIVRHLPAVEGLGSCTIVASDKTGTLTVNQLTAKRLWLPRGGFVDVGGQGFDPAGEFVGAADAVDRKALEAAATSAVLCNDGTFDPRPGGDRSGDTVDIALLVLSIKAGLDPETLRASAPRVGEIPFAAERRFAASLNDDGEGLVLHAKGAPEVLLPLCAEASEEAFAAAETMARSGLRVLAVTRKDVTASGPFATEEIEAELDGLSLLALVGFIDPLRAEARDAVAACQRAGVAVGMVTGDHPLTALAIARELGLAREMDDVVTGRDIIATSGAERQAVIAGAHVFARVEPTQKADIVDALRAAGHVVAVTGDGVNDAPALRRADLGVAMGQSGTDVARDAADLVLTDDNFASIVAGIQEGRAAYANIRKVIYLLVSTGAAEVVIFMLAITFGYPLPLGAAQLLWLNLVTNGGQDVALAFENREPGLLDRPPRSPDEPIFDRLMIAETVVSGAAMGGVAFAYFAWALASGWSEFEARNALLFLMVAFENVQVFNCRSETRSVFRIPLSNNWPVVAAVVVAQGVHIGAAFVPGLSGVLQMEPISVWHWLALVPIALSLLVVMEAFKLVWRWRAARAPSLPHGRRARPS
jgi:magnesium-transporting ATPase (P-type)